MTLEGKVALVTGARQGLGKSISLGMAEAGVPGNLRPGNR